MGRLLYLGVVHSSNPRHRQLGRVRQAIDRFQPTIGFYEGHEPAEAEDVDATVRRYGESGAVRYFARQRGIPLQSLEPSPQAELAAVLESFGEEQVFLAYTLREVARQRDAGASRQELEQTVSARLRTGLPGVPLTLTTLEDFERAFRRHWEFPLQWWQVKLVWFDPSYRSTRTGGVFTNELMQASYLVRDRHMVDVLAKAVRSGERVLAVVGRSHLSVQEPALRCALTR